MIRQLVSKGDYDAVSNWLRSNPTVPEQDLANSLSEAAFNGSEPLANLLIDHGADPNLVPSESMPPLFCAVEQRNFSMIMLLVARGADVNLIGENGQTALHLAIDVEADCAWQSKETPSGDLVALLLEFGADSSQRDSSGQQPIDIAHQYEFARAIKLLEQRDSL